MDSGRSVLPIEVTFISTPLIIRFLGTESYGVLLLIGLIPTYLTFADFGMGIAAKMCERGIFTSHSLSLEVLLVFDHVVTKNSYRFVWNGKSGLR